MRESRIVYHVFRVFDFGTDSGMIAGMRLIIFALLSLATSVSFGTEKPNIIYILLDDAGYGDFSAYGQKKFRTPNIDRLATEGMKFTQHYSGSTVCAPTRCVLMTGLHTGHSYVRGNREVQPEGQAPMPADIVTIPRLLKGAGYTTGAFGKWGLGSPGSASDPMEHFDTFYGYNCQRHAHTYYPTYLWKNREKVEFDGETHSQKPIMAEALQFIRDNKDKSFFSYMAITMPHAAMHVEEEYSKAYEKKFPQYANKVGKYAGRPVQNPIAAFAGMMKQIDEGVGQVMKLLKELDIDDNTLVMLTSDNGPHKEGGHDPDFFDSNGPWRGYKRDLSEGGIRTVLLARWPRVIEPKSISAHVSAHWDMMPTFCDIAGIKTPENTDGLSILPTLTGKGEQKQHEYLYWEFYESGGKKAVRFGDWKGLQNNIGNDPHSPIEIYRLLDDPAEQNDLSANYPDLVEKVKAYFSEAHTDSPNWEFKARKPKKKKPRVSTKNSK